MLMRKLEDLPDVIKPRATSNWILWTVVGFVVLFFVWASIAEIERTVRGMGRVIPSSQLQIVSNQEGGVVEDILVRAGDVVQAGAPLLRLDPTATGAELGSGEASYYALLVKIARLQAEVAGREPVYPSAANPAVVEQIRTEQALHASRMADLAGMTGAANARLVQAQRAVSEAQSAYQARISARDARAQEARIIRPLVERGIEPRLSLVQAESAASVAASEAAAAASAIGRAQAAVVEARQTLAQIRQDWREQAATELAAAQAEVEARRRALPALAERVDRTLLRAPLPGRINRVLVTTRGAAVQPGQPLVEIVPSEDSLLIEARVLPEGISFVRMGQQAKVAITLRARFQPGIGDIARGANSWPDATVSAPVGRNKSVDLVPCGSGGEPAADVMIEMLQRDSSRLARYYDAVFLVASVAMVSAGIPAAVPSAGVIYCAQPGVTPLRHLRTQLEAIRSGGGVIRGVVLWDAERPLLPTPRELSSSRRGKAPKREVAVAAS